MNPDDLTSDERIDLEERIAIRREAPMSEEEAARLAKEDMQKVWEE